MKKVFYLIIISAIFGKEIGGESYLWPTNASKTLTTVFGDVRPRRYHAGLDVRTYGVSGHDLYAIEKGYIERVRVSSSGYGKAIYLRLIDGRIAVYAHMSTFTAELETAVKQLQKKENSYSINQLFEPGKFNVEKGEIIGYTGDTGSISGPHLHFEIRDKNNKPLNPLLTNYSIKDTRFPIAHDLAIIPLEEISRVNGEIKPITIPIIKVDKENYKIEEDIHISGPFGLAVKIIDRIDDQPFRFGLFGLEMYIDEQLHYSIKYENFDFDEGELVYTERDYALIRTGEGKFYRLFKDGSRKKLSFHEQDLKQITQLEIGTHNLKIIAYDYNQNEIVIRGEILFENKQKQSVLADINRGKLIGKNKCNDCEIHQFEHGAILSIPNNYLSESPEITFISDSKLKNQIQLELFEKSNETQFLFNPTELSLINGIQIKSAKQNINFNLKGMPSIPGKPFELNIGSEIKINGSGDTFYDTAFVWIKKNESITELSKGEFVSDIWEIGPDFIPYRNQIEIEMKPHDLHESTNNQISIYYLNKKNMAWYFMPTTWLKDKKSFKTSALSGEIFALIKETTPPKINGVSPKFGKKLYSKFKNELSFTIKDDLSGIDGENDVKIMINDNIVIHEYNSYRREIIYDLNENLVLGENTVKISVNDRVGNTTILEGMWKLLN